MLLLFIDNLRMRLREWQEQNQEPDLVQRFRRLWRQEASGARPSVKVAVPRPTLGLRPARVWHLRRAS